MLVYIMNKIMDEKIEWIDYPYIGLGEKPSNGKDIISDDKLEKLSY